ncbi:required for meiotic nuclear division protein 1 homolog [Lycorma delicatula]|uniref:required for meiotic nuclear division protein 1 homolog n=1 Tax=Lycorma delicatula TaxID=130591 RepID=UPI003F517594
MPPLNLMFKKYPSFHVIFKQVLKIEVVNYFVAANHCNVAFNPAFRLTNLNGASSTLPVQNREIIYCNYRPFSEVQNKDKHILHNTSRVSHKKRIISIHEKVDARFRKIMTFATAAEYDLEQLRLGLLKKNLYTPFDMGEDFPDILYAEPRYILEGEMRYLFFFREGAVACWNMTDIECTSILQFLRPYEFSSYDRDSTYCEGEVMTYSFGLTGKKTTLDKGHFTFPLDLPLHQSTLDKYTISNAIVLSVKLGVWERFLEKYVSSIQFITEDLRLGKPVQISRHQVLQKTGELFALRNAINLSSDLLGIPDFYWNKHSLEKLYIKIIRFLSVPKRTKVINEKINYCFAVVNLISSHLSDSHHVRLEWMIIILIMAEVGIEIFYNKDSFNISIINYIGDNANDAEMWFRDDWL